MNSSTRCHAFGNAVLFGLGLCLVAGLVHAQAVPLPVDLAKSRIAFGGKQTGIPYEGKFGKFNAAINWDAAKPEASRAEIIIEIASFDLVDDLNKEVITGKEWFDGKAFPQAKFVSSLVKSLGAGKFEAAGKLSIKGHTRDVVAPFTLKNEGSGQVFEGILPIKRLQFGIGEGSWSDTDTVADDVQIKFKIVTGATPAATQRKK